MGRHSDDDNATEVDWEAPPPVAPLWRTRIVPSAVLLLAVLAATWWAVSWLTSPAGPTGAGAPSAVELDGGAGSEGVRPPGGGASPTAADAEPDAGPDAESGAGPSSDGAGSIIVHVAGEVREPGLVDLPTGSRVADALQAAGGPTADAELDRLNLAAPAVDASQILVPGPDTPEGSEVTAGGAAAGGAAQGGTGAGGAAQGGTGNSADGLGTVNINTADASELEDLPGIGPALAGRIVDHREQVGPYASMADLDAVPGIGPAMLERLDGLVGW